MLGIINISSNKDADNHKEIKKYSPPPKEIERKPKLFDDKKKKVKTKISEPVLKLEEESPETEEEPLILEEVHKEKSIPKKINIAKKETKISPAARKMASEANVNLENIQGTGKNGVILKEDIMSLMGSKPSPSERKIKYGPEESENDRLRLTIAKRLKRGPRECCNVNYIQ